MIHLRNEGIVYLLFKKAEFWHLLLLLFSMGPAYHPEKNASELDIFPTLYLIT